MCRAKLCRSPGAGSIQPICVEPTHVVKFSVPIRSSKTFPYDHESQRFEGMLLHTFSVTHKLCQHRLLRTLNIVIASLPLFIRLVLWPLRMMDAPLSTSHCVFVLIAYFQSSRMTKSLQIQASQASVRLVNRDMPSMVLCISAA
jgi:hypothetical protein